MSSSTNMKKRLISIFRPIGSKSEPDDMVTKPESNPALLKEKSLSSTQSYRNSSPVPKTDLKSSSLQAIKVPEHTKAPEPKTQETEVTVKEEEEPKKEPKVIVKEEESKKEEDKLDSLEQTFFTVPQEEVKKLPVVKKKKKKDDFDWLDFLETEKPDQKKEPLKPEQARKMIVENLKARATLKKFKKNSLQKIQD